MRTLKANEIEVRVGQINEKGATLLLYKDARADMVLLDEMGKPWKREHQLIDGKLFCTVSVWNSDIKEWESRQDVGTESNTEKEKGQASDSFKRACVNWGIGRELYSAPFLWINADSYNGFVKKTDQSGKKIYSTYDKFSVKEIVYDDNREITSITIVNTKTGQVVYPAKKAKAPTGNPGGQKETTSTPKQDPLVKAKGDLQKALRSFGHDNNVKMNVAINTVLHKNTVDTVEEANEVMQALQDGLI